MAVRGGGALSSFPPSDERCRDAWPQATPGSRPARKCPAPHLDFREVPLSAAIASTERPEAASHGRLADTPSRSDRETRFASYRRGMGAEGFGSSIVIALAALLWLVYLVPTWFRRREYLSTERNAVRLQQTLRIMAETAELPEQVRAETSARSAAAQERVLRARLQREKAIAKAQLAAADRASARQLAERLPALAAEVARGSSASRRLRRSRALTSLVLLGSLIAAGFGVAPLMAGSWLLLASALAVAVGSFAMLGQMAAVSRARADLARGMRMGAEQASAAVPVREAAPEVRQESGWTPVPVPKPLYLSRPRVDRALEASLDAAAALRDAAAAAERRLREAQESPEVTPIVRPAAASTPTPVAAPPSRFARMGYLEGIESGATDLDAVLQRRRASAAG